MLRMTVESIHQMETSVGVCITKSYHVSYDSGELSPNCNFSMCLHYEQLACYVWQWRIFTRWHYQYVSALRTVTILRMTMESIHQLAISVCVWITNKCHVTYDNGGSSPDDNISMCLHYEQLQCYVWYWRLFTRCQYQYVSALRTDVLLRMIGEFIHQMTISVCYFIKKSYHVT